MKYKQSKFNLMEYDENGDLLVINTLKLEPIKITSEKISSFNEIIGGQNTKIDDKLTSRLIDLGIIVPIERDEIKLVEMKHNEVVYGTDTLNVEIIPTNDCNFDCSYCFEKSSKDYMSSATASKVINFFKREIPHCKTVRIDWFGGEPLLCKDIILQIGEAVEKICRENRVALFGTISTNGYLLDLDLFKKLINIKIYEFQICVDGPRHMHNKTRPHKSDPDSYEKIINNLLAIKKNVKSTAFSLGIRCNITPNVEPFLPEYLQTMQKYFADDSRFFILFQSVRDWGGEKISKDSIPENESRLYKKWYSEARKLGLHCADMLKPAPFVGYCTGNRKNGYVINYDGSLHKCSLALHSNYKDINRLGDISDDGKKIIDEAQLSQWLVHLESHESKCKSCNMFPLCVGGFCFFQHHIKGIHKCDTSYLTVVREYLLSLNDRDKIKYWEM